MSAYAVQIEVLPQYVADQSNPLQEVFAFAYTVTVTNTGTVPAQLISRQWVIQDERGHTDEVNGLGVVGQQPVIEPHQTFHYTSGAVLQTPVGTMEGSYEMLRDSGDTFKAMIPRFTLAKPGSLH